MSKKNPFVEELVQLRKRLQFMDPVADAVAMRQLKSQKAETLAALRQSCTNNAEYKAVCLEIELELAVPDNPDRQAQEKAIVSMRAHSRFKEKIKNAN